MQLQRALGPVIRAHHPSAWTTNVADAIDQCASSPILAPTAGAAIPHLTAERPQLNAAKFDAVIVPLPPCAITNVNVVALHAALSVIPNINAAFVSSLVHSMRHGFRLGYSGPRNTASAPNRPSALAHPAVVSAALWNELDLKHTAGPFAAPPFPHFISSPLACIPKKPDSWRLILDLSAPAGRSVNDGIPRDDYSVQYTPFDRILRMIATFGRGALIAKVDLRHAFRQCPVHPDDWPLLCYQWENKYFVDLCLPFGLRSSPALFNRLADALEAVFKHRGAAPVEHYLDDYITAGPPGVGSCASNKTIMLDTCAQLGVLTSPGKALGPDTCLPVLGIEVDTVAWVTRLPAEKIDEYRTELARWRTRVSARRKDVESLLGKLLYACRVVVPGRAFVAGLIHSLHGAQQPHQRVSLSAVARADVEWWCANLAVWNGCSVIGDLHSTAAADLALETDASGGIGFGAVCDRAWLCGEWHPEARDMSIHWKELFAVYIAVLAWGRAWVGKRVVFRSDNLGVVDTLRAGRCPNPDSMVLMRHLAFLSCKYNITCTAEHVPGVTNTIADALSRLQLQRFRALLPTADDQPTTIPAEAMTPWRLSYSDYTRLG